MNISEALREAIDALEEAKVPDDLREVAFTKVVEYKLRSNGTVGGSESRNEQPTDEAGGDDSFAAKLSNALGLPFSQIERVYGFDGERLDIIVNPRELTQNNAGATKELALLYCAAFQASGLGEWVHVDTVRGLVEEFGRYDGSNFSKAILALKGQLWVRNAGNQRELKITRDGLERAKELIGRIAGGGNE